jgi:aspartyl-tRNA(Asn)/glutamyl-tRNA(Gln) amidotransferase subunit A
VRQEQLQDLTISKLSSKIKRKELSPLDVTKLFLERIERLNPAINAFVTLTPEQALSDAKAAEKEIHDGNYRGPLHGIPISIKDNIATKGVRTTAGSKVLADWVPDFDATVVTKLKEAGAILLGKTNMHEWASGGTTINPFYGTTYNPWDLKRIPGGSSGGSAAAVAASMCLASIGTDNAGSVRMPASYCGVVGLKPTYGRVSRFGDVAGTGAFSSDHFGTFTKTVEDCTLVFETIAGHDPRDPLCALEPVLEYSRSIGKDARGLRLGIIEGYFDELMVGEVKDALMRAVGVLESLGMSTTTVSIPHMNLVPAVQTCTSRVENVSAHVPHMKKRARDYSPYLLHRQICALTIPAATYLTAQRVRRVICDEFDEALKHVDVLVTPTVAIPAETIEECGKGYVQYDGKQIRLDTGKGSLGTLCTIPFNVTGLPAISVCCGFSLAGLPIGMQIAGAPFQEDKIFRIADAYERAAGWSRKSPQLS